MTASVAELRDQPRVVRIPRSTDNGLWEALVTQIDPRSAAGSRLVGLRPGQPLPASGDTVVAMFSQRTTEQ